MLSNWIEIVGLAPVSGGKGLTYFCYLVPKLRLGTGRSKLRFVRARIPAPPITGRTRSGASRRAVPKRSLGTRCGDATERAQQHEQVRNLLHAFNPRSPA